VVTFLALLEMAKLGLIRLSQPPQERAGEDDIYISATASNLREQAASAASSDDEYR
jgi:chromatin segregation and condensation protein Rec8/ScpA/Scc1 (kleisin family)